MLFGVCPTKEPNSTTHSMARLSHPLRLHWTSVAISSWRCVVHWPCNGMFRWATDHSVDCKTTHRKFACSTLKSHNVQSKKLWCCTTLPTLDTSRNGGLFHGKGIHLGLREWKKFIKFTRSISKKKLYLQKAFLNEEPSYVVACNPSTEQQKCQPLQCPCDSRTEK